MKCLYLMRHGKAVARNDELPDFERGLIKRGEKDAGWMAAHLADQGVKPDLILSSPAVRAFATARIVAGHFNIRSKRISTRKAVYEQPAEDLLKMLQGLSNEYEQVILVGHDPALTSLAGLLATGFRRDIPTSGVVGIRLKIDNWVDLAPGDGEKTMFHFPGAVREGADSKSFARDLERKLVRAIADVLREIDMVSAAKIDKLIARSSGLIARKFALKVVSRDRKKSSLVKKKADSRK